MAVINPVGFLHNAGATNHALMTRLAAAGGVLLPDVVGELRARGGVRMPGDCNVTQQQTGNMSVRVASGMVYVPGPTAAAGTYSFPNDALVTVTVPASHATLPRRDLIVARVADSFYAGAANQGEIVLIPGNAAADPTDPALPAGYSYTIIAHIRVPAGAVVISNSDITMRAEPVQIVGAITPVLSTNSQAGKYVGQYRDHPTQGPQRWNGSVWTSILPLHGRVTGGGGTIANNGVGSVTFEAFPPPIVPGMVIRGRVSFTVQPASLTTATQTLTMNAMTCVGGTVLHSDVWAWRMGSVPADYRVERMSVDCLIQITAPGAVANLPLIVGNHGPGLTVSPPSMVYTAGYSV